MGHEVPLHFGGRMGGAARNRTAMTEALVASEPALADAFEAGIDVRLGTAVLGLYGNGGGVGWMPGRVALLMDEAGTRLLGFDAAVVATGARDMGLAFPGWERPGVMGAAAAWRLAARYGAFEGRRAVVVGTTAEAARAAEALTAAGATVAAFVEQAPEPVGGLAHLDAPVLTGSLVLAAEGGPEGVTAVRVGPAGDEGRRIPCDTVVLGVAAVPVIELLDAVGCRTVFDGARGGHVPALDGAATSVPGLFAAGDCAGTWPEKTLDPEIARAEGRRAGAAAAGRAAPTPLPAPSTFDAAAYRLAWVRAGLAALPPGEEPHVCQCEEVTAREILEVRPPRYLGPERRPRNDRSLLSLLGEGPPNPDQVKRLTRAGMGACQGRRCREQVACLLALGAGVAPDAVPLASHRAPVRPVPLSVAADTAEPEGMAAHWDTWFGIPEQYKPAWALEPAYTAARRDRGVAASE
jgi:thioredoxin reductase